MRKILALILLPALLLAGCGGGHDGSSSSATPGGGSSSAPAATNTVAMTVDSGPAALQSANLIALNIPYISVTICAPGTSQCQTIDHISVDTGSTGFRVIASVLDASLAAALPAQNASNGQPVSECIEFADGYVFGPVVNADLKVGSETAANIPIQLLGSTSSTSSTFKVPSDCVSGSMGQQEEDTVQDFGANGVLGIAAFLQDCGPQCESAVPQGYYTCDSSGTCTSSAEPLTAQVSNPVASFATDNNGVALQLQSIGANGAQTATGTLIFGIGTQSNNMPGSGTVVLMADGGDNITTTYKGTAYNASFFDSGSNGYFINDSTITQCPSGNDATAPGFFCPMSDLMLSATNTGNVPNSDGQTGTGPTSTVNFTIGNAVNLLAGNPPPAALNNVGGMLGTSTLNNSVDFGLPFFYGRTVYFALDGAPTPLGTGPYFAY